MCNQPKVSLTEPSPGNHRPVEMHRPEVPHHRHLTSKYIDTHQKCRSTHTTETLRHTKVNIIKSSRIFLFCFNRPAIETKSCKIYFPKTLYTSNIARHSELFHCFIHLHPEREGERQFSWCSKWSTYTDTDTHTIWTELIRNILHYLKLGIQDRNKTRLMASSKCPKHSLPTVTPVGQSQLRERIAGTVVANDMIRDRKKRETQQVQRESTSHGVLSP